MDRRTKRQKLERMANQAVSPHEAEIARKKLEELPPDPPPRHFMRFSITINGITITDQDIHDWGDIDASQI